MAKKKSKKESKYKTENRLKTNKEKKIAKQAALEGKTVDELKKQYATAPKCPRIKAKAK